MRGHQYFPPGCVFLQTGLAGECRRGAFGPSFFQSRDSGWNVPPHLTCSTAHLSSQRGLTPASERCGTATSQSPPELTQPCLIVPLRAQDLSQEPHHSGESPGCFAHVPDFPDLASPCLSSLDRRAPPRSNVLCTRVCTPLPKKDPFKT